MSKLYKPTVTIGIPAYNEDKNLGYLLKDILSQSLVSMHLDYVYVVSDASTDNTVAVALSYKSKLPIQVISHKHRQGKTAAMEEVFSTCKSDVVVVLDADTRIPDPLFLSRLITPIVSGQADLTSADQKETTPKNWFSKAIWVSAQIKHEAFIHFNSGDNFLNCHGQARAFSSRLYKSIKFPGGPGEDLYSYIYCKNHGFKFQFVPDCVSYYQLPQSFSDHFMQSHRFQSSITNFRQLVTDSSVLAYPCLGLIFWTLIYALRYPISSLTYLVIYLLAKFKSYHAKSALGIWQTSTSTKSSIAAI